jgi:hypothetical protein
MTKSYLFIDDESGSDAPAELYAEQLNAVSEGSLAIKTIKPGLLGKLLEVIADAKPDGLLLDVAFTNATTEGDTAVAYNGIALAQQIRTLQTLARRQNASGLPEFPLIRFSKANVVREYVDKDTTSDDLFDEKVFKEDVIKNSGEKSGEIAMQLFSLASDYPAVCAYAISDQSDEVVAELLACPTGFLERLDARIAAGLKREGTPAHLLARYLTGVLLSRPGPLIDESLLAVRLGVDSKNSPDWSSLRELLSDVAYKGAFASGYRRWWQALLLDWWGKEIDGERAPFRLTATERVQALSAQTKLSKLGALPEDPASPGSKFWHLCFISGRPVDPTAGFQLMPIWGQQVWQDGDYLCLEEARRASRHPRLDKRERARLASLKG